MILGVIFALTMTGISFGQYRYNNFNHNRAVDVIQKRVEFDAPLFLGLDGYYSVRDQINKEKHDEKFKELTSQNERLQAQLELLLKMLAAGKGGEVGPAPAPAPESNPSVPATPTEPEPAAGGDGGEYTPTELDRKVFDIFNASCKKCHSEGPNDNGITLITKSGALRLLDLADRVETYNRVQGVHLDEQGKARMPKGSAPLPDDKLKSIYLWMMEESDRIRSE